VKLPMVLSSMAGTACLSKQALGKFVSQPQRPVPNGSGTINAPCFTFSTRSRLLTRQVGSRSSFLAAPVHVLRCGRIPHLRQAGRVACSASGGQGGEGPAEWKKNLVIEGDDIKEVLKNPSASGAPEWKKDVVVEGDSIKEVLTVADRTQPKPATQQAGDAVQNVAETAGEAAEDVAETAGEAAEDVADTVGRAAGDVVDSVGESAGDAVNTAGEVADTVGEAAGDAADTIGEAVEETGQAAAETGGQVVRQAQKVGGAVAEQAQEVGESVAEAAGDAAEALGEAAEEGAERAESTLENVQVRNGGGATRSARVGLVKLAGRSKRVLTFGIADML
jgi:hypothetical protein